MKKLLLFVHITWHFFQISPQSNTFRIVFLLLRLYWHYQMLRIQFKTAQRDSRKMFNYLFSVFHVDINVLSNRQAILLSRKKAFTAQFDANKSKSIIHHDAVFFFFWSKIKSKHSARVQYLSIIRKWWFLLFIFHLCARRQQFLPQPNKKSFSI